MRRTLWVGSFLVCTAVAQAQQYYPYLHTFQIWRNRRRECFRPAHRVFSARSSTNQATSAFTSRPFPAWRSRVSEGCGACRVGPGGRPNRPADSHAGREWRAGHQHLPVSNSRIQLCAHDWKEYFGADQPILFCSRGGQADRHNRRDRAILIPASPAGHRTSPAAQSSDPLTASFLKVCAVPLCTRAGWVEPEDEWD
jgi:hypothetical protein